MIDDTTSNVNDDLPRPPAGRRSAKRPAGPPIKMEEIAAKAETLPSTELEKPAPKELVKVDETGKTVERVRKTASKEATVRTRRRTRRSEPTAEVANPTNPEPALESSEKLSDTAKATEAEKPTSNNGQSTGTISTVAEAMAELQQTAPRRVASPFSTPTVLTDDEKEAALEQLAASIANPGSKRGNSRRTSRYKKSDRGRNASADSAQDLIQNPDSEELSENHSHSADKSVESSEQSQPNLAATDDNSNVDSTAATVEDPNSGEESEGTIKRRRRRRGGRRRRRGNANPVTDSELENAEESESQDSDTEYLENAVNAVVIEEDGKAFESGAESEEDTDEDDEPTFRRRRRKRRRRGEETGGTDDTDADVVVRVRDPHRIHAGSSEEVAGIPGYTRVTAKRARQRSTKSALRRRSPLLSEAEFLSRRESVERVMAVRQGEEYTEIAVLEDNILVEHYVDRKTSQSLIGNIYLGRVQNVLPSMEAAFIDIGRGRNAVLYAGEVAWDEFVPAGHPHKIEQAFKSGQTVLVQVTKDPVGFKGARLTSHISIPGRYIVYSPKGEFSGISRKLPVPERNRLKNIMEHLIEGEAGVIVRTAAEGVEEAELTRDVQRLTAQWAAIQRRAKQGGAPALLYAEPVPTLRIVRDLFTEDFTQMVVEGNGAEDDVYDQIQNYMSESAPHLVERVQKYEPQPQSDVFTNYRVDEQIAKALERKVFLPSGGSLVIDRTEAMTVIDVNTGKFTGTGGNLESTVTSNNLEAAEEIVRQLRLRDIGGIIVIDFIDMVLPSNRELLLRRLVECLGRDRTRHQVSEVTSLGLVQLTRKKIGTGLAEAFTVQCETCSGRGYHVHDRPVSTQKPADGGARSDHKHRKWNKNQASSSPKSTPSDQ